MFIEIGDRYILTSDTRQYKIKDKTRSSVKNGVTYYDTVGYYVTLEAAMHSFVDKMIRNSESTSLAELNRDVTEIREEIIKNLRNM